MEIKAKLEVISELMMVFSENRGSFKDDKFLKDTYDSIVNHYESELKDYDTSIAKEHIEDVIQYLRNGENED